MNIYNRSSLISHYRKHPDCKETIEKWYLDVTSKTWKKPSDVTRDFNTARTLKNNRAIFKINENDYASTKGAIVSFTRSLASNLIDKGIRVNGVAPGPVWTPLIASTFKPGKVAKFGSDAPMERAGEPLEIASAYLFLASDDSSYYSGQFLHPNGGEIVNG